MRTQQAASVDPQSARRAHQPELHGEPEETCQRPHHSSEAPYPLTLVVSRCGQLRRRVRASTDTDQCLSESGVGVHGNVACDVVKDVRLGQVVDARRVADRHGRGELAVPKAVEEKERRQVPAYRAGFKTGQLGEKPIHLGKARYSVWVKLKRAETLQKMRVG